MPVTLRTNRWLFRSEMFGLCQRCASGLELLRSQADVGVPPEASRKHTCGFDGRRVAQPRDGEQRAECESPAPPVPLGVVLGVADDLDEREDVLPAGRVADCEVAPLDARPARGGMGAQPTGVDLVREDVAGSSPNEKPVLEHRPFLTRAKYARRIRACALLLTLVAVAVASGCGSSSSDSAPPPAQGTTTTTAATTTNGEGIDPLEGAGTHVVVGKATAKTTALLERLAVGRHEGYDRVVFQFRGDGLPGYRVEYVEPPFHEDGSGNPVTVPGNAFVLVRMEPASGFDLNTGEGEIVYKGPKRVPGASVVQEVVRTGDFEAVLSWVIGLQDKVDFRVQTLSSPSRLVVDFRNH
jgi:hypothetical protein